MDTCRVPVVGAVHEDLGINAGQMCSSLVVLAFKESDEVRMGCIQCVATQLTHRQHEHCEYWATPPQLGMGEPAAPAWYGSSEAHNSYVIYNKIPRRLCITWGAAYYTRTGRRLDKTSNARGRISVNANHGGRLRVGTVSTCGKTVLFVLSPYFSRINRVSNQGHSNSHRGLAGRATTIPTSTLPRAHPSVSSPSDREPRRPPRSRLA